MLDEEKSDEEEGGTRRKGGRGARRDEESEKMIKLLKNEKVAKGRIIGLAGPCFHTKGTFPPRFNSVESTLHS